MFVGLLIFFSQTYFAFDSRAETEVYLRYGQHPELYPNRRGEIVQGLVSFFTLNFLFSAPPKLRELKRERERIQPAAMALVEND